MGNVTVEVIIDKICSKLSKAIDDQNYQEIDALSKAYQRLVSVGEFKQGA